MVNKQKLLEQVKDILSQKISSLEKLIEETRASNTETKSSMGDKYETSREMIQQEVNRLVAQLAQLQNQQNSIQKVAATPSGEIKLGTLIETNLGFFYLITSLGELEFDNRKIILISTESPLAKAMLGKRKGDVLSFNQKKLTIINIW